MTPARFTETTRQHGLYRRGMGLEATRDLATLVQAPVPLLPHDNAGNRKKQPSCLKWMGKLITAGFAKLDGDHYRATPEGQSWLGKLIEHNIFKSTAK